MPIWPSKLSHETIVTPVIEKKEIELKKPVDPKGTEPKKAPIPVQSPTTKQPSKTFEMPTRAALKENINKPKIDDPDLVVESQVNEGRNKSFTLEELSPIWKGILLQKEQAQKSTEIQIFQGDYTLKGEAITVSISNEALLPIFERIKFDLINELRNTLENDNIVVNAKVVEIENGKMRYTDSEKFEYLKEKHPLLQNLQDKLHLDPEF
mgnify:CR=1 FL=1